MNPDLDRAREDFRRGAWREAATRLAAASARGCELEVADLERLATANYLSGRDQASLEVWNQVHRAHLEAGRTPAALRSAFWLTLELLVAGEWAQVSGWLARCRRLVDSGHEDSPECGLLLVLQARAALREGDIESARDASARAIALAERFGDPELRAFALLARGQVLVGCGTVSEAARHLDEAMVSATSDGISPIAVGTVYCAVIDACRQLMDLRRMREWTEVLKGWCDRQAELVPFRGVCLVHRAEVLRIGGAWTPALEEARLASGAPATPGEETRTAPTAPSARRLIGVGLLEVAEIQRLRGAFAEAETAYREAHLHGCSPGAGLALLHQARGNPAAAAAAVRRALAEPMDACRRTETLAAAVEIEIAAGDIEAAARAAQELRTLAVNTPSAWRAALADHAEGHVLLAEGEAGRALERLRAAWMGWQEMDAPYEAARVRVAMALAHRALGDVEAPALELDAAERVFERLGAEPELRRIAELRGPTGRGTAGLTARELEVLRRLATGMTNRAIGRELFISERTVDRHVSNILAKLELPSRAAATAYAYEHQLL